MAFVELTAQPAACAGADGATRSLSSRLWHAKHAPGRRLRAAADLARSRLGGSIGRVESAGRFEDAGFASELKRALPPVFAASLRPSIEWYGCVGAFFHNDAHYDGVLFGVWSIEGPARELVFPRPGTTLPAAPGNLDIFDPYEPHAVLDAGARRYRREDYLATQANVFLGFEVDLTAAVRAAFGIGPAGQHGVTLSSRIAVNPETGALAEPT